MPNVDFVDKDDRVIGSGSVQEALEKGHIHRIARVYLFNSQGELLIQRRANTVTVFPGRWDHSAAGHVDIGEDYQTAAYRELKEEVGVDKVELKEVVKTYFEEDIGHTNKKKMLSALYTGTYDGPLYLDKEEVSEIRWIKLDELGAWLAQRPNEFTPAFLDGLKAFLKSRGS